VAQVTSRAEPASLSLVVPLRFALLDARGVYHHAAVLLFEALARRPLRDAFGDIDTAAVAGAFEELAALDDDSLRARASEAWRELFRHELPQVSARD
jgi:hypothetical protein